MIVVVAAGAGDDGIGVNGVVFHAVDVGRDEVAAGNARQDGLFGAVNGGTEQRQVEAVRAHRRDGSSPAWFTGILKPSGASGKLARMW